MSVLNNVNATEVLFDDFTNWHDYEDYAFIWGCELHRFSADFESVLCVCTGEVYNSEQLIGEEITPVKIVKIDYVTVQKYE